jgi:hypothetical protein
MFLNLTVTDSGVARLTLEPLLPRIRSVDSDLPVMLFVAPAERAARGLIVDLRSRGYSWARIYSDLGLRYDPLFADYSEDVSPRYRYRLDDVAERPRRCTDRLPDARPGPGPVRPPPGPGARVRGGPRRGRPLCS